MTNVESPAMVVRKSAPSGVAQQSTSIQLRTDFDLLEQFLRERCSRSTHTRESYKTQLRRLAWFCRFTGMSSVREFKRENWADLQSYLRNPPAEHIMIASVGVDSPSWAPFRGALSESSAKQAEIVIRNFFEWLSDPAIGAISINPVRSIRTHTQRRSATRNGVERFINEKEWSYIESAIVSMKAITDEQKRIAARARWVVDLAILTGLRASEIASSNMGMIRPASMPGAFCLHITRKGGVESNLPLLNEVLLSHRDYLKAYSGTWIESERASSLPLVLTTRLGSKKSASAKPLSRTHIWRVFKDVMLAAADVAQSNDDPHSAERLRHASTHWLRHTFGTRLLDAGADIRSVRDLMDHASISTTNQYLHRPAEKLRADLQMLVKVPIQHGE